MVVRCGLCDYACDDHELTHEERLADVDRHIEAKHGGGEDSG